MNHLTYRHVACPACGSRGLKCRVGTLERSPGRWHEERIAEFAKACGCPDCTAYLARFQ